MHHKEIPKGATSKGRKIHENSSNFYQVIYIAEWENKIKGGSKGVNVDDDNCNLEEFVANVIQLNLHLQEWLLTLIAQDGDNFESSLGVQNTIECLEPQF